MPTTTTQAVSPGYIYTVTASSEAIVRDVETDKLLCKANNGSQGMFVAIGGTVSMATDDPTATITQASTTSGGARFEVYQTRPTVGEEGVIYLIPITSGTDEDNEYEEWIWVKGEWERLGTTGVNLSNYATLTGANTYSGNNTFNGLLIKANSDSLGDNSVLNRFEADARYGRLAAANTWLGDQTIDAGRTLTLHPTATIAVNNIRGNAIGDGRLNFNSLHLTNISDIDADGITTTDISVINILTNKLHVGIIGSNSGSLINVNSGLNIEKDYGLHTSKITTNATTKWLTIEADNIDVGAANISGIHTLQAQDIINGSTLYANTIATIDKTNYKINLSEVQELQFKNITGGATLSGVKQLKYKDTTIGLGYSDSNSDSNTVEIRKNLRFPEVGSCIELRQGIISGVKTLNFSDSTLTLNGNVLSFPRQGVYLELNQGIISSVASLSYGDTSLKLNQGIISGVKSLVNGRVTTIYDDSSVPDSFNAILVAASEGIKVTSANGQTPTVTIAPSKIEALPLSAGKYGLRITPDSCQLYGIDFAYGDVWSSYYVDDVQPAFLSADTVKIKKPALTLDTTGVASLAFGKAPKVLFRTFPNGGETAIFEFQSGHWSDDSQSAISTGMVDLRKPSIPYKNLQAYSLINKSELLELVPLVANADNNILAIGRDIPDGSNGSINIGMRNSSAGIHSIIIGGSSLADSDFSVVIGMNAEAAEAGISIGCSSNTSQKGIGIGYNTQADNGAIALGYDTSADVNGIAIGYQCATNSPGMLNISTGGEAAGARCSMLWYGGTSYADRDTTGYLSFEIGNTVYNNRYEATAQNDTVTISKPNLWSALDRAKYRGAQPYAYYIASAIASIPTLEPNSITHIGAYSSGASIDLSGITLAQYTGSITTAELWIEVASAGTSITWPEGMLWPDEVDPTVAPSFTGPETSTEAGYIMQRLYCVTLRTQRRRNLSDGTSSSVLIASIAYAVDSKLPIEVGGGGGN